MFQKESGGKEGEIAIKIDRNPISPAKTPAQRTHPLR
jgi:hypothetical protein